MMKKVTFILTMIFAVALLSTSCCKDDPIVPDPVEITVADLVGDWEFESLEFDGEFYTGCDVDLNEIYDYVTLSFRDMTTTDVMLYTDCMDNGVDPDERVYPYILSNNIINCNNGSRKFEIMNVETFNGTELVVKFKSASVQGVPIGGIYTLHK